MKTKTILLALLVSIGTSFLFSCKKNNPSPTQTTINGSSDGGCCFTILEVKGLDAWLEPGQNGQPGVIHVNGMKYRVQNNCDHEIYNVTLPKQTHVVGEVVCG